LGTTLGRSDHVMMTSRALGDWGALVEQGCRYSMDFKKVQ